MISLPPYICIPILLHAEPPSTPSTCVHLSVPMDAIVFSQENKSRKRFRAIWEDNFVVLHPQGVMGWGSAALNGYILALWQANL